MSIVGGIFVGIFGVYLANAFKESHDLRAFINEEDTSTPSFIYKNPQEFGWYYPKRYSIHIVNQGDFTENAIKLALAFSDDIIVGAPDEGPLRIITIRPSAANPSTLKDDTKLEGPVYSSGKVKFSSEIPRLNPGDWLSISIETNRPTDVELVVTSESVTTTDQIELEVEGIKWPRDRDSASSSSQPASPTPEYILRMTTQVPGSDEHGLCFISELATPEPDSEGYAACIVQIDKQTGLPAISGTLVPPALSESPSP